MGRPDEFEHALLDPLLAERLLLALAGHLRNDLGGVRVVPPYLGELLLKILDALHARPVVAKLVVLRRAPPSACTAG